MRVYLLGAAAAVTHADIAAMPDLTATGAAQSGARAYAQAGVKAADIDVVQVYDAFTINTILFLEDLGFCAKVEGGAFAVGGRIAPGGALPVNTSGGGLSYCHGACSACSRSSSRCASCAVRWANGRCRVRR